MYKVGDYVYFETSPSSPYSIRRIEEFNKTPSGNVETKVMCFFRRRDVSSSLVSLADKHHNPLEDSDGEDAYSGTEGLSSEEQQMVRDRELFLSRQVETLPATHIRGKCSITLLHQTEKLQHYINKPDIFFYSLVYDPTLKTLQADRGEIRVGSSYQAVVPKTTVAEVDLKDEYMDRTDLEELIWDAKKARLRLDSESIERFFVVSRAVGTFARAFDLNSSVKQPGLHVSAAAASRDLTLAYSHNLLHESGFDINDALKRLLPQTTGPVLARDEMEEWSMSECQLFEEALEKYGKDFSDIRQDFLPWKDMKSVIEYYYMWKTTDQFLQQKRLRSAETETKLKQVYIPAYTKTNPNAITLRPNDPLTGKACVGCGSSQTSQWYNWGNAHVGARVCAACWDYWRRYSGLRNARSAKISSAWLCPIPSCSKSEFRSRQQLIRHLEEIHSMSADQAVNISVPTQGQGPGSPKSSVKIRPAFCLVTTLLTRIARRISRDILEPRRAARNPFRPINVSAVKLTCQERLTAGKRVEAPQQSKKPVSAVLVRLGIDPNAAQPAILTPSERSPSKIIRFPAPKEPVLLPSEMRQRHVVSLSGIKRPQRPLNGLSAPESKRPNLESHSDVVMVNGDSSVKSSNTQRNSHPASNGVTLPHRPKKTYDVWLRQTDDIFFKATDKTKLLRNAVSYKELRRYARSGRRVIKHEAIAKAIQRALSLNAS